MITLLGVPFYNTKETCDELKLSYHSVKLLIDSGELKAIPHGKSKIISKQSVEDYIKNKYQ